MDEVRTIYTWVDCAWLGPTDIARGRAQFDISQLSALSMPIALRLGPPVAYQAPDDGEKYPDSIRRIFPKPLQAAAFSHPDPSARAALQERIVQVIGSPSSSHS